MGNWPERLASSAQFQLSMYICVRVYGPLAAAAEHAQQLAGVHALLLGHLLHIKAHVHKELNDIHLLSCELVSDSRAGGVAVRPRAAVNQMHRASFGWSFVVPAVVEAAVPAVQRSGQRGAFNLNVRPVAKTQHKRVLSAHRQIVIHLKFPDAVRRKL